MPTALEVATAVKTLFASALDQTQAAVIGLDGSDASPGRVGPGGRVIVDLGDPGQPQIDLCPPTYNYQHQIPVTVEASATTASTAAIVVANLLQLMGTAITADRFLGGLVDYLDAYAPPTFDETADAAPVTRVATIVVIATYSTTNPL